MSTYIVTWNPLTEGWTEYASDLAAWSAGQHVERNWAFRNRSVDVGDRVFMLRQRDQRGIVASGYVVGGPLVQEDWRRDSEGEPTTYVPIRFDAIVAVDDRLSIDELTSEVSDVDWNSFYFSGRLVPEPAASQLGQLWNVHLRPITVEPAETGLPDWTLQPGEIVTRAVVADKFGGATQGGIQPSRTTANIMIYSDPSVGRSHGYDYDGPADGAYYYTGEGQLGDQTFRAGNRAIRDHADRGRVLRLFEAAGPSRPGGKPQRYLGAYAVDPEAPYRHEPAPDRDGRIRNVIVFRLIAAGPSVDTASNDSANAPSTETLVEIVPVESNSIERFDVAGTDARESQRWEATLMRQLEEHLTDLGHVVRRATIRPAGDSARLVTDTYDVTSGELFEVKPDASRAHVRAAVAQLLDYRRHLSELNRATVLLPRTPSRDLQNFITSTGLTLAVFHDGTLTRIPDQITSAAGPSA